MRYLVLFYEGPTSWGASVPDLPGCYAVGKTRSEAESLIQGAMKMHIERLIEMGDPVPEPPTDFGLVEVA